MPTVVYRYALAAPHVGSDLVIEQMRAAHRYRNVLTEIERGRRAALRRLDEPLRELIERVAAAEAKAAEAAQAIKKARAKSHKRSETASMREDLKAAREERKQALTEFRDKRKALRDSPEMKLAVDEINERANDLTKNARQYCGVYWGTYLPVEASMRQTRSMSLYDGVTANDPQFQRWGDGAVSVQLQKGLTRELATAGVDSRLKIKLPVEGAFTHPSWSERHRRARTGELTVRIGSDGSKKPVFASWRMDMHRDLPQGSVIKWVSVHRCMVGPYPKWHTCITVEAPACKLEPHKVEAVAVDLGWRQMEDGSIRVAKWYDSDKQSGELRLDPTTISLLRQPDDIRSERDSRFDVVRMQLERFIDAFHSVPDWLKDARSKWHAWKAKNRLTAVYRQWCDNRFEFDDVEFGRLQAWYYWETELFAREAVVRQRALRRRREIYRVFAARMAEKYGTIILEQFDLREVARKKEDAENQTSRSNRQLAAVSELRLCQINACKSRGRTAAAMPAQDTTRKCNACGHIDKFDQEADLHHRCSKCSALWDQDDNAAVNLLSGWREHPSDAKILVDARKEEITSENSSKQESRWAKAKRMKAEKEAERRRSREDDGDLAQAL